jgi:hypothetical protein
MISEKNLNSYANLFWYCRIQGKNISVLTLDQLIIIGSAHNCKAQVFAIV